MVFPCKKDETRAAYASHGQYVEAETAINEMDEIPHLSLHIEINDEEHRAKRQYKERRVKVDEHYVEQRQRDVRVPSGPSVCHPYERMGQHKDPMNNGGMAHGFSADQRRNLYMGRGATAYDSPEPHRNTGHSVQNACQFKNAYAPNDGDYYAGFCEICSCPTAFVCQRCCVAHYCSKLCQETDWPQHRGQCQAIPGLVKKMPPTTAVNMNAHVTRLPQYQQQYECPTKRHVHQHKAPQPSPPRYHNNQQQYECPTKRHVHQHEAPQPSPPRYHNNQQQQRQQRRRQDFDEAPQRPRSSANGGDSYENRDFGMDGVPRVRQELMARYLVDERNARETFHQRQQPQQQQQQQHHSENRSARVNNEERYAAGPPTKRPRYEERVSDNVAHIFRQPAENYDGKKRSDAAKLLHASSMHREQADYLQEAAFYASQDRVPRVVGHRCPRAGVETASAPCRRSRRE